MGAGGIYGFCLWCLFPCGLEAAIRKIVVVITIRIVEQHSCVAAGTNDALTESPTPHVARGKVAEHRLW